MGFFDGKDSKVTRVLNRVIEGLFIAIALFVVTFFISGEFGTDSDEFFDGYCTSYDEEWISLYPAAAGEIFQMPIELAYGKGETIDVETVLPSDIADGTCLCFLTARSMDIYIDGELRLSFDDSQNQLPGGIVKSHYLLLELDREDSNRLLVIRCSNPKADNSVFNEVLYGDKIGITMHLIRTHGPQFALAALLAIFAIMVFAIGLILQNIYRQKMPIVFLALGILLTGLWIIFDSFLYQIIGRNYYVDGPMEYMLVMSFPYCYAKYLDYEQEGRYSILYQAAGLLMAVNFIVETVLHMTGMRSYLDNILFVAAVAGVGIGVVFFTIIADAVRGFVKRYRLVACGIGVLASTAVIQLLVLTLSNDEHGAAPLMFGLFAMLTLCVIHTVIRVTHMEEEARKAKHTGELKSGFLANMSHEIRTPINAILGMNELVLRESSEPEIRKYAVNIENAGNNLLGIINDILDFSKIDSGKLTITEDNYSLSKLLNDVSTMIEGRAAAKQLEYRIVADEDLPDRLYGDENRIRQILLNILNNAVKYTEKGWIIFRVSRDCAETDKDGIVLRFEAKDTGIGIREEDLSKLFNTFERLDLKKNRAIEGTGLGLAITHNLVQLMHGDISVRSEYGKGSVFTVTLPQKIVGSEHIGSLKQRAEELVAGHEVYKESFTAPEARILVVDDVVVNIAVVKGLLKKTLVQVDQAMSGAECLRMCNEMAYDLILLDHMMPEMDGVETLHRLKDAHPDLCPVIVLTANAIEGMRDMYIKEGFDDYLSKPTKPDELEGKLRAYLPKEKLRSGR